MIRKDQRVKLESALFKLRASQIFTSMNEEDLELVKVATQILQEVLSEEHKIKN